MKAKIRLKDGSMAVDRTQNVNVEEFLDKVKKFYFPNAELIDIFDKDGGFLKRWDASKDTDNINPGHYRDHPSGIECIQITEHMGFNLGNAVKYIWRCDLKADAIEDLKKAQWYIEREIARRTTESLLTTESQVHREVAD